MGFSKRGMGSSTVGVEGLFIFDIFAYTRGGSRGKSDRCKLIIVMELLGGSGHAPPGKFSNLEPWKHHLLLSAQLFLSNLAACYSSNFT